MASKTPSETTVVDAVKPVVEAQVEAVAKTVQAVADTVVPAAKSIVAEVAKAPAKVARKVGRPKAKVAAVRKTVAKAAKAAAPAPKIKKAAKSVVTAARKVATPVKKEMTFMATTFETPKFLTDMNDRAKASFEKSQKFAAEFGDFNKGNVEAIVESGKIAAKGFETLGQDNADYTRKSFEGLTATVKSLGSVKSPTDFFKLQGDYMRSAFDAAVAQTSKNTEAFIKLASDAAQPISNRFAVAVEKAKAAA